MEPEPLNALTALPRLDPEWEEQKERLWRMTPKERIAAMRTGRLTLRLCLFWAHHRPLEVPKLNGEWEFIAILTPEVADADDLARVPGRGTRDSGDQGARRR